MKRNQEEQTLNTAEVQPVSQPESIPSENARLEEEIQQKDKPQINQEKLAESSTEGKTFWERVAAFGRREPEKPKTELPHFQPTATEGLTSQQVAQRMEQGAHNKQPDQLTRTIPNIVFRNIFTLFNLLNIVLATTIIIMGDWKNALFIGVAISNTAIGIFQEIRSKQAIDRLSIIAESKAHVLRDGKEQTISQEDIVLDDVLLLSEGNQIPADGKVLSTEGIEIDESMLTGEANQIQKQVGENVLSGSFVTAGTAAVQVRAVRQDNYAAKLSKEAKTERRKHSKLMRTLNNIIRVLTVIIVPIGALLFYSRYSQGTAFQTSVLGATAAMLGMIPEGLILLTSVTFAVGAMNLAKHDTLVQTLPSIETLARADVLCLDKTGTITDGHLTMEQIIPVVDFPIESCEKVLSEMLHSLSDNNPTAQAIRKAYNKSGGWIASKTVAFSSQRKWSGASYPEVGSYLMGAPEFLFSSIGGDITAQIDRYTADGFRVLALAYSPNQLTGPEIPEALQPVALLILSDNIRPNAVETFTYFAEQGVELKVISGDNPVTVSHIARKAAIPNADKYIDMSTVGEDVDYVTLVREVTVFGRVSPYQKRELVRALQSEGKTVCMTGDGVNDVLALREADCAVAMVGGSDAARSVADFVLLGSDFGAMVEVLKEGRRVINNIESVASLYLVKTIYSTLLSVLYIYLPYPYPFSPLQMSPINGLTVGIPSFFLALEANYRKPEGRFIANVLENSVPAAVTVLFNILVLQLASVWFTLTLKETSTMAVLLTGTVGFILLYKVSQPFDWKKRVMLGALIAAFFGMFTLLGNFYEFASLFTRNVFFYLPLMFSSRTMFFKLNQMVIYLEDKFLEWRTRRQQEKKIKNQAA